MAFPTKPLSECARLASGGTPSKANSAFWDGPIAWLTPKDMARFDGTTQDSVTRAAIGNGTREASEESLFIAVRGMSLHNEIRVVRPQRKMAFNQDIKAITPVAAVDGRFLYYAFLARIPELLDAVEAAGHGTGVLPTDKLTSLPIPDLSLPEQRAIAATLGALDDKIELNRNMNATLESMARALFRNWFVDFGPTKAEATGATPYLAPDLWSLFPDRLDDEGKPEGWEVGKMSDLFTLQRGFDLPAQNRRDGKYPILAASGPSGFHESHMVKGPGVTTGRSGVLGRVFYVRGDFWPLNTSLWVKDFKRATPLYAYQFLSLMDLSGFNAGSAVPTLNRNHVHGLPAVLPPHELIVAYDHFADSLMTRHQHNEVENETLAQTRDLLLPRLMSGELRVAEAERIASEVA